MWYLVGCQTVNTKGDPSKAVQVRTQLAAEYIKSNDYDAAKRTLDQALDIDSRDASANMMMGVLLQREGSPQNVEKAERYFKHAIAAEPKMHRLVTTTVRIYIKLGVIMTRLINFKLQVQL